MIKNDFNKILDIFKKYSLEWFINVTFNNSKDLEYSPLHDEVSLDDSESISTSVVVIKDNKRAKFSIDSYSLEKIESSIKDILSVIEFAEQDTDIVLPDISDSVERNFSAKELENIDFKYLKQEFSKFKNYKFNELVKIETFSIWVSYATHYFLNTNWSFKVQKDNSSFCYFEIFWENWNNRDAHYKYISKKSLPILEESVITEAENELLDKISDSKNEIKPWVYDVTLERDLVINFLDIIFDNLWAESIREWISLFSKNKLWDKIFSDKFTIINNPELEWYTWTMLFDGEWVTAKKTILFQNWVFTSKFYDYKNALKEWLENLWNSQVSNIEFVWETDKDYLKKSDFLFTNLMAFHTVDMSTWKFALNWEWYLLKDWKKSWFVKNISLTWNLLELFSSIKTIWDDFKVWGNFKVPSITFEKQNIV